MSGLASRVGQLEIWLRGSRGTSFCLEEDRDWLRGCRLRFRSQQNQTEPTMKRTTTTGTAMITGNIEWVFKVEFWASAASGVAIENRADEAMTLSLAFVLWTKSAVYPDLRTLASGTLSLCGSPTHPAGMLASASTVNVLTDILRPSATVFANGGLDCKLQIIKVRFAGSSL
jgi:hypothetical protein